MIDSRQENYSKKSILVRNSYKKKTGNVRNDVVSTGARLNWQINKLAPIYLEKNERTCVPENVPSITKGNREKKSVPRRVRNFSSGLGPDEKCE